MTEARKISTPLVLATASSMLALAAVLWFSLSDGGSSAVTETARGDLSIDDRTPERAAQSFYDAWRRRRWPQALAVSVGRAHQDVLTKQARDEEIPPEERAVVERMWDALARAPLELVLDEAEMMDDRTVLHGIAEYMLVNRPYRRRVSFVVEPRGERFRVAEMRLGEVLTPLPDMFAGATEEEQP